LQQTVLLEKRTPSASQIFRILWKPEGHYPIHKSTSPVPNFSQISPRPFHSASWRFILILSCHLPLDLPSVCWKIQA